MVTIMGPFPPPRSGYIAKRIRIEDRSASPSQRSCQYRCIHIRTFRSYATRYLHLGWAACLVAKLSGFSVVFFFFLFHLFFFLFHFIFSSESKVKCRLDIHS